MSVWKLIAADLYAWKRIGYLGPARANSRLRLREVLVLYWRYSSIRATIGYRLSHAASQRRIPLIPMWLCRRNLSRYGLDIMPSVPIGPGLYIPHPVGTVIMATAIGANFHIISAVTIGMRNEHAFPVIGDNVTIGAGARVLGKITIGDGAQIGANAVVITDVPSRATAVGIPARIIPAQRQAQQAEPVAAGERLSASPSSALPVESYPPPVAADRRAIELLDTAPLEKRR